MAQLMPLPLTVSCFSEIQIGFTFLVPADSGSPRKRAVKRVCVCVCTYVCVCVCSVEMDGVLQSASGTDAAAAADLMSSLALFCQCLSSLHIAYSASVTDSLLQPFIYIRLTARCLGLPW